MVTQMEQYYKLLYLIQNQNPTEIAPFELGENHIYNIDLNSRTVEAPQFLSVATDHRAEMLFFKTNRYFDGVDLATMTCVIQYVNAARPAKSGIYVVPYIDIETLKAENNNGVDEIIFPWLIEGRVTEASGSIAFAVQFFKVDELGKKYEYNLNTQPAQSKVLAGNKFNHTAVAEDINNELNSILEAQLQAGATIDLSDYESSTAAAYAYLLQKMNEIQGQLKFYWTDDL